MCTCFGNDDEDDDDDDDDAAMISGLCIITVNGAAAGGRGVPVSGGHLLSSDAVTESSDSKPHQATRERRHTRYWRWSQ